jgi:hypothetical protein
VCVFCAQFVNVECCLMHTNHETGFLYSCNAPRTVKEHMEGHLTIILTGVQTNMSQFVVCLVPLKGWKSSNICEQR